MNKKPDIIIPYGKTFGVLDDLGNMRVFEMVTYTPDVASAQVSQNNDGNRIIRRGTVEHIAAAMKEGRFVAANSQTIAIDAKTGNLLDGQHRLFAISKSGCTQRLLTEYLDNAKEAYLTMDAGVRRTASDFLTGVKSPALVTAIAAVAYSCEFGALGLTTSLIGQWKSGGGKKGGGGMAAPRDSVVRYAESHADELTRCAEVGEAMRAATKRVAPAAACGIFYWLVRFCGRDILLDEFVEDFTSEPPTSKTVSAVRGTLTAAGGGRAKFTRVYVIGKLLDAYEHYCKFDDCVNLTAQSSRLNSYDELLEKEREKRGGQNA